MAIRFFQPITTKTFPAAMGVGGTIAKAGPGSPDMIPVTTDQPTGAAPQALMRAGSLCELRGISQGLEQRDDWSPSVSNNKPTA